MTTMDTADRMTSPYLRLLSKRSAALFLWIALITTPLVVIFVLSFGTAAYLDGDVPNATWIQRVTISAIGFLPWLVAAPTVVLTGFRQAVLRYSWLARAAETVVVGLAIFALMLVSMTFVMAPFWGTTIDVIIEATEFRDWIWDILFFIVALLSGQILGTIRRNSLPTELGIGGGKIMARSASRVDIVDINDVIAASAQGNYVALITRESEFLHRTTLAEMKKQLDRHGFVQVHRSHLARADSIASVTRADGRIKDIHLQGGRQLPVSAGNQEQLKGLLRTGHIAA
ncbi:LytTR family DNA-binding domain-containing protein [Parasphingopyxis lamellibrachiae]|uniref:DNA-binding LytR/AlgR family response regulator n=1 Tax=Parasphingopyxis lamellibrachiae TaxID=680125 RepID=A0A3D9FGS6_9SPHN|nr:LytTR family DNA-binding domain-containing protein [Parasphingopyxis lamellibrachiae]RED16311.1 DNA-binding LytR/AlgR family response regulator [Parasphingopyxis lamellibrachiae]